MEVVNEEIPVQLPPIVSFLTNPLEYGQAAVDIFIVLSGYCLMLPLMRSGGQLRDGLLKYLQRRARRILPPYYAAMVVSLTIIAFIPGMNRIQGYRWDEALPAFHWDIIISHLMLVHNWKEEWRHSINPPMWSVATEWQIYFLFPLLLLPIWRRFGNVVTVVAAFVIGLIPHFAFRTGDSACPWFLGLFALGMAAAAINASPPVPKRVLLRWMIALGTACLAIFGVFVIFAEAWLWRHLYFMDALIGAATTCFLVFCTAHCYGPDQDKHPAVLQFLEKRSVVVLGTFSYSLYLMHFPILSILHSWIRPVDLAPTLKIGLLIAAGTPLCLLLCYGFHLLFERRFMPGVAKKGAPVAAVTSPAP